MCTDRAPLLCLLYAVSVFPQCVGMLCYVAEAGVFCSTELIDLYRVCVCVCVHCSVVDVSFSDCCTGSVWEMLCVAVSIVVGVLCLLSVLSEHGNCGPLFMADL